GGGGSPGSGGSIGTGGAVGTGGAAGTGGSTSTGGSPGSGGSVGSGGALGTGGSIDAGAVAAADASGAGGSASTDAATDASGGSGGLGGSDAGADAAGGSTTGADAADAAGGSGDTGEVCDPNGGPRHPFGSHFFSYTNGSIRPSGTQQSLDATTTAFYTSWKAARLVNGCGGYYVSFGGKGKDPLFVSEGHGYGMLIAALMAGFDSNAHTIFDGFYDVFRKYPSINNGDLMGWAVLKGCALSSSASDLPDSATDGDLDIAFALLLADKQWGSCGRINYLAEAKKVIA